jgi:hypothetical protein
MLPLSAPVGKAPGNLWGKQGERVYRFSRSIYRELAPRIQGDQDTCSTARLHILEASEETIRRLATDGRYFARPARTLFTEVRDYFGLAEQVYVHMVIDRYLSLAIELRDSLPDHVTLDGQPRQCPASTRKGTPCRRDPRPGREYCPSHRHLEENLESFDEVLSVAEAG